MLTSGAYIIRAGGANDRAAVRELTLAAYGEYADVMAPSAWKALRQAILAALDVSGPVKHLVAEQEGAIIGSVLLFPASDGDTGSAGGRMIWPELRLLAVTPAARGKGVAQTLVEACIEQARDSGAKAIGLYTSEGMRTAITLYERRGFVRVPEHDFRPPGAELVRAYHLPLTID